MATGRKRPSQPCVVWNLLVYFLGGLFLLFVVVVVVYLPALESVVHHLSGRVAVVKCELSVMCIL